MFLEQVGRELKSIRARNDWTLEKASEIVGIHKNTLSIYENNSEVIQLGKLFKILTDYGVDIDIFFKHVCENIHSTTDSEDKIIHELGDKKYTFDKNGLKIEKKED